MKTSSLIDDKLSQINNKTDNLNGLFSSNAHSLNFDFNRNLHSNIKYRGEILSNKKVFFSKTNVF